MTPLLTLRILFHTDRLARFAVVADFDIRQAFAMTVTGMGGRRGVIDRMLAVLSFGQHGRFLLRRGHEKRTAQREDS